MPDDNALSTTLPLLNRPVVVTDQDLPDNNRGGPLRFTRVVKPDIQTLTVGPNVVSLGIQSPKSSLRSVGVTIQNKSSQPIWREVGLDDISPPRASQGSLRIEANGGVWSANVLMRSLSIFVTQDTNINDDGAANIVIELEI